MESPSLSTPRLARLQAQTGLVIAAYLVLHLANTIVAVGGEARYDAFQRVVRYAYQNPVSELVLLASVVVHAIVGVVRFRRRRKGEPRGQAVPRRVRVHRYAAYFLLLVIVGHVAATRLPAVIADIPVGFRGLAFAMQWIPGYFYPYYTLLALAGLYHGLHGAYLALGTLGVRVPQALKKGPGFYVPITIVGAGLVLGILALGGVLFPIHDPRDSAYARMWEAMTSD